MPEPKWGPGGNSNNQNHLSRQCKKTQENMIVYYKILDLYRNLNI